MLAVRYPPQLQEELLPAGALPAFRLSQPELQFPGTLNITDHFLEPNLVGAQADRIAYHSGERSLTYRELNEAVNRLGNGLRDLGVGKGDRVVLRIPNCLEFVVCALALHRLAAVVVPTNVLLLERTVSHILNTTEAKCLIASAEFLDGVEFDKSRHPALRHHIAVGGDAAGLARRGYLSYEALLRAGSARLESVKQRSDELATVFFTSGTTGLPKGCMHLAFTVLAGAHVDLHMFDGIRASDVVSGTPPLAFTFGYGHLLLLPLLCGIPCVLIEGRVEPEKIFKAVEKHRISLFHSVPSAYTQMLNAPGAEKRYDLRSLRATLSASAPMLPTAFREWEARFGTRMTNGMGSSESFVSVFSRWLADPQPGSMGVPLPGWEVRILDEQGRDCARDVVGRLALRGSGATMYWRDPEKQAEAVTGGWSLTGDLVYQDGDGCYWHVCRNDDVIKSRGYRISPGEVEDALLAHGAVYEPAVIGAPDPVQGQKVKAFITLKDGHMPSSKLADEMRQFVRARLSAFQIPAEIEFIDAMPKTETGKIRRRDLKELEERRAREAQPETADAAKDAP